MFEYDLADRVDDLICIFDNGNPDSDMDTISILLTGWITFLFASVLLLKYIYRKFKGKTLKDGKEQKKVEDKVIPIKASVSNGTTTETQQLSSPAQLPPKELTTVQEKMASAPILRCSGPFPPVVDYVASCHHWFYADTVRKDKISENVNRLFLKSVNKGFHGVPHEDPFVATVDDLRLTENLIFQNLFAEYEGDEAIKITCDCSAKFTGHLSLSPLSTGQDKRHYEFIVNRFIGRLKFLLEPSRKMVTLKFDGWPEICLSIANTSKLVGHLDPKLSEVIISKLSSALRNSSVEMDMEDLENFPEIPPPTLKPKLKPAFSPGKETPFLRVQLTSGEGIGLHKDCDTAYCVIELDDPAQKFQSRPKNLPNPIWNESYVLNTSSDSDAEILFEVYSAVGGTFLGCHFVSLDQIVSGKKETLRLKSRRVKVCENISGEIEVVFTFINEHEAAQYIYQEVNKVIGKRDATAPGFDAVKITSADGLVQYQPSIPPVRPPRHSKLEDQYGEERGRRRTRRGDIFTSIHRRFSKERSKSVLTHDPSRSSSCEPERDSGRSISVGRPSVRVTPLGSDSTRSSASELSHNSSHSTATFIHESSTLLVQSTENGVKKYYLIPPEQLGHGRWKNKKKLHIFNDHTFVARRIQSGLSCTVCFGQFPFSLRKQGYQCRDCRLISHKECHIRIPTFCVKSKIYDIDVITVE